MERGFLSRKKSGGRKSVNEKSGGSIDVSAKKHNGVDEGTTTSSIGEMTQIPTTNVAANVIVSPTNSISSTSTSYPKLVIGETSKKSMNFRTLITSVDNGADVDVSLESIGAISECGLFFFQFSSMDGLDSMLENGPWFIRNNLLTLKKWNSDVNLLTEDGRSSYVRAKIELRADVKLKDTIVVAMPKLVDGSSVVKNLKNPSQVPKGVSIGPKIEFKPVKQVYRTVSKKKIPTLVEIRRNMRILEKSINTTPIVDKIEKLIIDGKVTLVDDEGKPLKKIDYSGDHDIENEVESVDNEIEKFLASKRVGYSQGRTYVEDRGHVPPMVSSIIIFCKVNL
nr:hypothetical protein [Tanacetum cinerariifolium]